LHLLTTNVSDCGLPAGVQGRKVHADLATQSPKQWKIVSAATPSSTGGNVKFGAPLFFECFSGNINWQLDLCGLSSPSSCGGDGLQATSAPNSGTNRWTFFDPSGNSGANVLTNAVTWIQSLSTGQQYVDICGGTGGTNGFNLHSTQNTTRLVHDSWTPIFAH